MFPQLLTPVPGGLFPSFVVATLPIVTVLALLGILRRPAWQASLGGLIVGLLISVGIWRLPVGLAFSSIANGATFAVWPIHVDRR
jgi:lactate permease